MTIKPFALERYFAQYEFSAKYLLSSSDCDGLSLAYLLSLADDECRMLWETLTLGYTESKGLPLLREEIVCLYEGMTAEQVLEVVPEEGIFLTMNAVLEPGDEVICMMPGYQSLYQIAESIGCRIIRWEPMEAEKWRFAPRFLRDHMTSNIKLVVINFPHNPTGYLPSQAEFAEIVEIVREHNVYLFSDEMYHFLEFEPETRLPAAAEGYDRAISLFGMSKTFGLAGLRTGWLVTKDISLLQSITNSKDYTTICPPAPSEILALIALRARKQIITDHLQKIMRNLDLLDDFFTQYDTLFSWTRPRAGTIGFARLHHPAGATAFCKRTVEETGIMLLPSSVYGYGDSHIRIGFGRMNMPEVIQKFSDYLERSEIKRGW